jgi:hypothetical protein
MGPSAQGSAGVPPYTPDSDRTRAPEREPLASRDRRRPSVFERHYPRAHRVAADQRAQIAAIVTVLSLLIPPLKAAWDGESGGRTPPGRRGAWTPHDSVQDSVAVEQARSFVVHRAQMDSLRTQVDSLTTALDEVRKLVLRIDARQRAMYCGALPVAQQPGCQ